MFKNRTKEKLAAGKVAWGIMMADPSPMLLELIGYCGFDWVLLDNEHGQITVDTMPNCVRACETTGITPIVRPIFNKLEIIRAFMDQGAHGVQVPQVETAEEAKAAVDGVKYPPLGKRGFFSAQRNNRYGRGLTAAEYLEHANRETLVCLMVETPEGIKNAEAIARVPGVDVVFVGQGDLSALMGHPGQMTHPDVTRAAEGAVKAILRAGKVPGCSCPEDQVPFWLERGVRYFHGSASGLLTRSSQEWLKRMGDAATRLGIVS
ncbi:MAG: 2-dehydro-3-deoxyglucarate aldolase [Chloroflexi bacterium]|nr:2-dehydro-3-deoxyglucarate aldolase [Chloroflexota bacterium]